MRCVRASDSCLPPACFLPDHGHAILFPPYPLTISGVIKSIKLTSTMAVGRRRREPGELWQGRFPSLGNGDGSFQEARNFGAGSSPSSVAVGDFNGDGLPSLAVANYGSNDVSVVINNTRQSPARKAPR